MHIIPQESVSEHPAVSVTKADEKKPAVVDIGINTISIDQHNATIGGISNNLQWFLAVFIVIIAFYLVYKI